MPVVLTFFGQLDLLQGGKILGWCTAFIRSIALMLSLTLIILSNYMKSEINEIRRKNRGVRPTQGIVGWLFASDPIIFCYITTAFAALGIVVAALLLLGIYKHNKNYVLPFILYEVLILILWVTQWIGLFALMVVTGEFGQFLLISIFVGFIGYLLVCSIAVYQHLAELEDLELPPMEIEMQPPNMNSTPVYRIPLPQYLSKIQTTRV